MSRSKWSQKVVHISALVAVLMLVGCLNPSKKSESDRLKAGQDKNTADFIVDKVQGFSIASNDLTSVWKLPRSRFFSFKACLKSVTTTREIVGQKFRIESGETIFWPQATDINGCLQWHETIPYPYFGQAKHLLFKRTIVAEGTHRGSREIELAVNPWASLHKLKNEIVYIKTRNDDGSQSYVPSDLLVEDQIAVAQSLGRGSRKKFPLWMDDLQVHIVKLGQLEHSEEPKSQIAPKKKKTPEEEEKERFGKVGDGVRLQVNINMRPKVLLDNMKGGFARKSLQAGRFRVYAQVIATDFGANGNEKLVLFPDRPSSIGTIDPHTGILSVPINVRLTRRVAEGTLRLAIRVIPLAGPESLEEYQGLYLLGEYDQIRGPKKPLYTPMDLQEGRTFDIDRYLEDASNYEELVAAHRAFKQELYELDTLKINWLQVQPGETSTTRTIEYRAKTCVRDMMTGRKMKDLRFKIRRIRDSHLFPQHPVVPEVMELMTDQDGCLAWVDEVTHKYYKPEDILFPTVEISRGGFEKVLGLGLNPWDDKFTFGFDVRDTPKEYVESIRSRDKIPSRFFVTGYAYETLRFRYNIDEYMNLEVKKTVSMRVDPEVLRYNSIVNGLKTTERLRDGIYLMKMALMKDYIDPTGPGNKIVYDPNYRTDEEVLRENKANPKQKITNGAYVVKRGDEAMYQSYISSVSKLVRVQAGKIITPVEFSMRDLRLMRIRNQFLIQLETIDEKKLQVLSKVSSWLKRSDKGQAAMEEDIKIKIKQKALAQAKLKLRRLWDRDASDKVESEEDLLAKEAEINRQIRSIEKELLQEKKRNQKILSQLASRLGEYAYNGKRQIFTQMMVNNILTASHFRPEREVIDDKDALTKRLTDLSVPFEVQEDILKGLEKNDFTINPAAPIVELAKLLDTDSGLEKRTFIGPMTLLLNGNKSSMRPTDSLDEGFCETEDCTELDFNNPDLYGNDLVDMHEKKKMAEDATRFVDNTKYIRSKHFGSVAYLYNWSVDMLIEKQKQLERAYHKTMRYRSLIYDFVHRHGLSYISLNDTPLVKFDEENCKTIDDSKCLKDTYERTTPVEAFRGKLNNSFPAYIRRKLNISRGDIESLLHSDPKEIADKPHLYEGLCSALARELADQVYGPYVTPKKSEFEERNQRYRIGLARQRLPRDVEFNNNMWRNLYGKTLIECRDAAEDGDIKKAFTFDRKLRIIKTGEYRYMGGKSMNINVAANTNLSHTEGSSVGASASAALGFIPVGALIATGHPIGALVVGAFTVLSDFGSRVMRVSWDNTRNRQDQKVTSEQTFLVMQTAVLDIKVLEHEKCVVINLSHDIKKEIKLWKKIERQLKKGKNYDSFASGFMLCSGVIDKKETAVRERYYYFTQHFTEGDMLDSGDLYNHPWLLMLRGARAFRLFIDSMQSYRDVVLTDLSMLKIWDGEAGKVLKKEAWPIRALENTYRNITPSFPGLYTELDESYERASYPWGDDPENSFLDVELKKIGTGAFDKARAEREAGIQPIPGSE